MQVGSTIRITRGTGACRALVGGARLGPCPPLERGRKRRASKNKKSQKIRHIVASRVFAYSSGVLGSRAKWRTLRPRATWPRWKIEATSHGRGAIAVGVRPLRENGFRKKWKSNKFLATCQLFELHTTNLKRSKKKLLMLQWRSTKNAMMEGEKSLFVIMYIMYITVLHSIILQVLLIHVIVKR